MHKHLTPTFSIVTVTYNAGKALEDTIQSVITQTYHHIEYIVVDGASTDGTLAILNKYQSYISTLITEPDKGIYDAMNKGLKCATGDYICFLNAGDSLKEDDTLFKMVHTIKSKDLPDVLYGQTALVDANRRFLRMRRLEAPEALNWKSFKQGMLVCHQAFFAKRTLAEPYDLQYRFSSDFDWCIRMMKKAKVLHNTHLTIIDYLEEGTTTQNRKASLKERFRIMVKHYGWFSTIMHHSWFVLRLLFKPGQ
ncbi:glycosyltransferase family 2 protein [Bacteroides sp. 519]|uniref:glycosyltransferase family 2 protein n=1 Tax=Bacteroides sp. 519 TaxID=2302937 RepID=UPI0013CF80EF|nr:glycosyltransferase family 2 protein [Bacteroides sp. 519]NDV60029.1 glycosyltransferase [Bacteroides sp. 519]